MVKQWKQWETLFSRALKSLQMVNVAMKLRHLLLGRKAMTNLDSILRRRDITWLTNVHLVKAVGFPVVMYGCESWTIKKTECQTVVLEKTLESPLDCKEIQPVNSKRNQSWIFIARTDAEAETPILWPKMWRTDSLEKTLMLGKTEGRRRGDDRGWDGWRASPTQWRWVWASSRRWWWTGKPGMLQLHVQSPGLMHLVLASLCPYIISLQSSPSLQHLITIILLCFF